MLDPRVLLSFPMQVLSWGKQIVAMLGSGPGYSQTVIITPYMHALIYHVPVLLRRHGSLKLFSRQGKYSCRLTLQLRFLEIVLSVIEYKHQSFIYVQQF